MIYDVVVVGSGFSAIATVSNLIEVLPESATVAVVGDDPASGAERLIARSFTFTG